jgi:hypothetical protein
MRLLKRNTAVPIDAPSPLVGEGITAGRHGLTWVRGSLSAVPTPKQPLTRLRFTQPPSPTRGEGKKLAPHASQAA